MGRGTRIPLRYEGALVNFGYSVHAPATTRRAALRKAIARYGARSVWGMLHAGYIRSTKKGAGGRRYPRPGYGDVAYVFLRDRNWVSRNFGLSR